MFRVKWPGSKSIPVLLCVWGCGARGVGARRRDRPRARVSRGACVSLTPEHSSSPSSGGEQAPLRREVNPSSPVLPEEEAWRVPLCRIRVCGPSSRGFWRANVASRSSAALPGPRALAGRREGAGRRRWLSVHRFKASETRSHDCMLPQLCSCRVRSPPWLPVPVWAARGRCRGTSTAGGFRTGALL